ALSVSINPFASSRRGPGLPIRSEVLLLSALLLVLLVFFLKKPVHIDDPLFIWAARQIQSHPGDPYGFAVNWYVASAPISDITQNPPLTSYYTALTALILGWSEPALHFVFLPVALAAAIGTYLIAARFCRHPLLAAFAAVLTPVFFVSSLTVMSDV